MTAQHGLSRRAVVCLTTHDRLDCARINQEIIKLNYAEPLRIVHACSHAGYEEYLEDALIRCEPKPLKEGALNLLRTAIKHAIDVFDPQFIIHLEADTWLLDERVLAGYVATLANDPTKVLATSTWSEDTLDFRDCLGRPRRKASGTRARLAFAAARALRALGVDAGIVKRQSYATQFFVLRNRPDVVHAVMGMQTVRGRGLEASLYEAVHGSFTSDQVVPMPEREPVQPMNRYWCDALDLYCQHWPVTGSSEDPRSSSTPLHVPADAPGKRESLLKRGAAWRGDHLNRLLAADNVDYYNAGAKRY